MVVPTFRYLSHTPHAASPSGLTMHEGLDTFLVHLKTLLDSGGLTDDGYKTAVATCVQHGLNTGFVVRVRVLEDGDEHVDGLVGKPWGFVL